LFGVTTARATENEKYVQKKDKIEVKEVASWNAVVQEKRFPHNALYYCVSC